MKTEILQKNGNILTIWFPKSGMIKDYSRKTKSFTDTGLRAGTITEARGAIKGR